MPDAGSSPFLHSSFPAEFDSTLLDAVLTASDDLIYVLDRVSRFIYVCPGGANLFGLHRAEMRGKTACDLGLPPDFQAIFQRSTEDWAACEEAKREQVLLALPTGSHEYDLMSMRLFDKRSAKSVMVYLLRDVTERCRIQRQKEEHLAWVETFTHLQEAQKRELEEANLHLVQVNRSLHDQSLHDGLTGLLNHRALYERLVEELQRSKRYGTVLAALLLDVDHFKTYNDAFGHLAGDQALQKVAAVLGQHARASDSVARYGGEEFFLILPQTDLAGALTLAERICQSIRDLEGVERKLTVSIGVCALEANQHAPADLIGCADQALYRAKAAGRDRVEYGAAAEIESNDHAL